MQQLSLVDALIPAGFGRNERLERISALIDWERLGGVMAPLHRGETGRPPYEPLAMFRALLLAQWYGLSDPMLEESLLDRVSFRRFCGFALDAATPDETTLCRFRNSLKQAGLGEALFQEVLGQLDAAGFIVKSGTLVDATLVRSAAKTRPTARRCEEWKAARHTIPTPIGRGRGRSATRSSATRRIWGSIRDRA